MQTSNTTSDSRRFRLLTGLVVGTGVWLTISLLGVPNVFHLDSMVGLVPFAIAGSLSFLTRARRVVSWLAGILVVLLLLAAYTGLFVGPAKKLIRRDPLPASANAIVVLSAGVTVDGFLQSQGLDRLLTGLALVRHGVAPLLIVTREERDLGRNKWVNTSADQDSLIALAGVVKYLATPMEASTHDEAMAVRKIASANGWDRVVLVTSPFHTRRACATFEHVGLKVTCVPGDSRDIAVKSFRTSHDRIGAFNMWIYEVAATLHYRRQGWI